MRSKYLLSMAAVALTIAAASAASAKPSPPSPPTLGATACKSTDITPGASACVGWYTGNLNGGSPTQTFQSAYALNALTGGSSYSASTLTWLEDITVSGHTIDFTHALWGDTIVSFHVGGAGGAGGVGYEGTAFYEFDAGNLKGGLDTFTFNLPGLSNARLYSTGTYHEPPPPPPPPGVPEPASWAMMLAGFFGLGGMLRSRRALTA
jgi:hypothetical protein